MEVAISNRIYKQASAYAQQQGCYRELSCVLYRT